jgi:hypothetical protein
LSHLFTEQKFPYLPLAKRSITVRHVETFRGHGPRRTDADCGRAGERFDFAEMIAYLETCQLARQYLPEYPEIIPQMLMSASGKIQKF